MNNQKGRSMVEMLGVLAIIGVLSVGAIAGYSTAMEKHKMNKYLEVIDKTSILAAELFQGHSDINIASRAISSDDLCKLNIVPQDICGNKIGNNETGNTSTYKGYFNEEVYFSVKGRTTLTTPYNHKKNDGTTFEVSVLPVRFEWGFQSSIPQKFCVNLLTNAAWKDMGSFSTLGGNKLGTLSDTELPLSLNDAKTNCEQEMSEENVLFNIMIWF